MRSEADYQAAADWAEHEMNLSKATGGTVLHRAAAAAHGRHILEQAAGGPAELEQMVRGRTSIDPDAGPGQHPGTRRFIGCQIVCRTLPHYLSRRRAAVMRLGAA